MVLRHRGYGVHIAWTDGQQLEEFNVKVENETTISCYIPSIEGRTFVMHWEDAKLPSNNGYDKCLFFHMDGKEMAASNSRYGNLGSCDGSLVDECNIRPFQFSPILTTDDDSLASQHDHGHEHLGLIEVEVLRTLSGAPKTSCKARSDHTEPGFVHERSKKAGAHCIGLGAARPLPRQYSCMPTYIDDQPYVVFRFRYRSRDILQAQGIIPPPPGPPSLPRGVKREREVLKEENILSDSDDDIDHLERKVKLLQDQISRKKSRKQSSKVKQESSHSKDIIDLT